MKISLAQQNFIIGDIEGNKNTILSSIKRAKDDQADLIVFPELCICGYPPLDLLEFDDFVHSCLLAIQHIASECIQIAAIVGSPSLNPKVEGKNLFNSAFFLYEGEIKAIVHKSLLPNYDVFDEYRYFEPNPYFECIEFRNKRIALTICEDLWDIGDDKMYVKWPMEELVSQKPDFIINIAASPFSYYHQEERKLVLSRTASKYQLPVFYVNHVGAQTDLIFDGGSMVLNRDGNVVNELAYFREDYRLFESDIINSAPSVSYEKSRFDNANIHIERIYDALFLGIKDYFKKMGFGKAIIGLSGGIDSAVVFVLAADALGAENVLGLIMPSPYSSQHSIDDALNLAKNIGAHTETLPINDLFKEFKTSLKETFAGLPENIAEENIQARIRAILLMAVSNKKGYLLLNTSNKSEAAVGYGTLYGDMSGGLSVIGDLYKTQVYELAEFLNRYQERIPENIIKKAPSAELRPDQKDTDSLPEYVILDKILFEYIEKRMGAQKIIDKGYDADLVRRVITLVNNSEYKRFQTPPVLRISDKSFGSGRRMPLVAKYRL